MESGDFYDFGPFRLDARKRLLLRAGQPVALTSKVFETLLQLVENSGRVMEKDELMNKLWPDTVVEEANLAQHISTLRRVLGESPSDHRYIVTVPGRGYRFVAEVATAEGDEDELVVEKRTISRVTLEEEQDGGEGEQNSLAAGSPEAGFRRLALPPSSSRPKFYGAKLLAGAGLVAASALVLGGLFVKYFFRQGPPAPRELRQHQLTSNPVEVPVLGAAVSPDGKYLATIDQTGIFLRIIQTGETHSVPFLKGFTPSLFPLKWFPDGTQLLVSGLVSPEDTSSLWAVSIFGGAPRKLGEGDRGAVSPDGSLIAYIAGPTRVEIGLMGANGEAPRKIVSVSEDEEIHSVAWAPTGHRLAYVKNRSGDPSGKIESCDLNGGQRTEILAGAKLSWRFDLAWSPGGRMIYSFPESQARDRDTDLWEIQVNAETGITAGSPRRLTHWPRSLFSNLSLAADGKRLVFLRSQAQPDVYVGELPQKGARMGAPRRLTLDDRDDWPQGWTADSRAVLFHSNRRGNADIFKQEIHGGEAQVIVAGPDEQVYPRSSPDGLWVLYWAYSEREASSGSWRLMRAPVSGGPGEFVLNAPTTTWFRCPTRPGAPCVLDERAAKEIIFFALDPIRGKGAELRRAAFEGFNYFFWDLSPDGSQVVIVGNQPNGGRFQIVPLGRGPARNIHVRNWNDLFNVVWSADGKSFLAFTWRGPLTSLLSVDFKGNARLLWEPEGPLMQPQEPVPSPDGRFLAFAGWTTSTNAWMIENF
jgi:DNA-binding winged helix-turn-helix (wHTH) protein/Tol biopolymer transport system component